MASVIQDEATSKKGIVYHAVTCLESEQPEIDRMVSYHPIVGDKGVVLSSCPWCGAKLGVVRVDAFQNVLHIRERKKPYLRLVVG